MDGEDFGQGEGEGKRATKRLALASRGKSEP